MPLLTYAGLSSPAAKRRNDGKSSNPMVHKNEASNPQEKKRFSNSVHGQVDSGTLLNQPTSQAKIPLSAAASITQNVQTSSSTPKPQERSTNNYFQLSNTTAMRLYSYPHPHRENHQRLSSRRLVPYVSAPSSPWKSGNLSSSTSTYLCPTTSTQTRIHGSYSRIQTIQRGELFGSDVSISMNSMSRSANVGTSLSNCGRRDIINKQNGSCSAKVSQASSPSLKPINTLTKSHEEQSPRINNKLTISGGSLSRKKEWLASGPSSIKDSTPVSNGCPTNKLMKSHLQTTPTARQSASAPSSPYRRSSHYGVADKKSLLGASKPMTNSIQNYGRIGYSYNDSNHSHHSSACEMKNDKRQSFGATHSCSSGGMSKSDSTAYKGVGKNMRCVKGKTSVIISGVEHRIQHPSHIENVNVSTSLNSSFNTSALPSSAFLDKVRSTTTNKKENEIQICFILF